jgi:hypothetical protein
MQKIYILILVVFSLSFYLANSVAAEKIDLKLDGEIGIVFINENMLLIIDEDEATLLALNKGKTNNINKFRFHNLNVVALKKDLINIHSKKEIILEDDYEINDVTYAIRNGLIYISYEDTNMCIYTGGEYNISDCQFVYFYNTKVSDITLYDYNEIIIYHYRNPLPNGVLENIYDQAIDTYQLRDDELAIIKLGKEDYDFIVIDNE